MSATEIIDRFMALYRGNLRSTGRYDPKRDRAFTEHNPATVENFAAHLDGEMGIGIVPIMDDDRCWWAAIDIDNHDTDEDIDIKAIDKIIQDNGLPLIACRSKSGGVHAYMFTANPEPAGRVRGVMLKMATMLGYGGSEIFPKQAKLGMTKDKGTKQLGNWINLPYFGGDDTMRYAVHDGARIGLTEFIDLAERKRMTDAQLRALALVGHQEAPPCVAHMLSHGVGQGHRNEALYNTVVYLKKAFPDDYEARAFEINATMFSRPLPKAEASRTISSASRPDYSYRCGEEPIHSLCNRDECLKRKFGITLQDAEQLSTFESLPMFSDLVKYLSEPVRWEITIDGLRVTNLQTAQLLDWRMMRELIADRLTKIVPMIKPVEWERILGPLMKEARVMETPDDASINGIIRARLREFAGKTDLMNKGEDKEDRQALLRGLPVVQNLNGIRCVVFRANDLVNYLKRTRSEELKGIALWFAVKEIGVVHTRIRVKDDIINVWYMPVEEVINAEYYAEPVEFKVDL